MWKAFHHPDISLPVVRRRVGLELLEMLDILGDTAAHGAYAFLQNRSYPNRATYYNAVSRLSKLGLIVKEQGVGTPVLKISEDGSGLLETYLRPNRWWSRKWDGIWYLLLYDVPEVDRSYRNVLRQFLKRQRMGCFQKSVWVAAHDIRPQYADLAEAAALDAFACLFEARTVLGMSAQKVVRESWDFEGLRRTQQRFCGIYGENLDILQGATGLELDSLMKLAAEEIDAYRTAFVLDPLLPDLLLPADYLGKQAYSLHLDIVKMIRRKMKNL